MRSTFVLLAIASLGLAAPANERQTSLSTVLSNILTCDDAVQKIFGCLSPDSQNSMQKFWLCLDEESCSVRDAELLPSNLIISYEKYMKDQRELEEENERELKRWEKRADTTTTATSATSTDTSTTSTDTSTTSTDTSTTDTSTTDTSTSATTTASTTDTTSTATAATTTAITSTSTGTAASTSTTDSSSASSTAASTTTASSSTSSSTTSSSATASSTPLTHGEIVGRWIAGTLLVGFAASGCLAVLILYCREKAAARKRRRMQEMKIPDDSVPLTRAATKRTMNYSPSISSRSTRADVALGQLGRNGSFQRSEQDYLRRSPSGDRGQTVAPYSPISGGNPMHSPQQSPHISPIRTLQSDRGLARSPSPIMDSPYDPHPNGQGSMPPRIPTPTGQRQLTNGPNTNPQPGHNRQTSYDLQL